MQIFQKDQCLVIIQINLIYKAILIRIVVFVKFLILLRKKFNNKVVGIIGTADGIGTSANWKIC